MSTSCEQATQPILLATFFVRDRLFALDTNNVQEVIRLGPLSLVYRAPPEVAGVLNLRGRIVSVLDIGLKLGLPKIVPDRNSRIFIIEDHNEPIGLLVDRVSDVVEIDSDRLEPLPANIPASQTRFFKGVCRVDGRLTTWLDSSAF